MYIGIMTPNTWSMDIYSERMNPEVDDSKLLLEAQVLLSWRGGNLSLIHIENGNGSVVLHSIDTFVHAVPTLEKMV